jgi:predicted small lipoprotein YifL
VAARFCGRCGLLGLALLALGLAGCGRRGDLDPPPNVPASQVEPMQVKTINPMAGDPAQPGQKPVTPMGPSEASNGKTFFLDPLVK